MMAGQQFGDLSGQTFGQAFPAIHFRQFVERFVGRFLQRLALSRHVRFRHVALRTDRDEFAGGHGGRSGDQSGQSGDQQGSAVAAGGGHPDDQAGRREDAVVDAQHGCPQPVRSSDIVFRLHAFVKKSAAQRVVRHCTRSVTTISSSFSWVRQRLSPCCSWLRFWFCRSIWLPWHSCS